MVELDLQIQGTLDQQRTSKLQLKSASLAALRKGGHYEAVSQK